MSEKTQINKNRDKKGDITTNTDEIDRAWGNTLKMYAQINWKI
jgi:hypothetical protein